MATVCFVYTSHDQPSKRFFLYPAKYLKAETCTTAQLSNGMEPDADTYIIERELWWADIPRLLARRKRVLVWLDDAYWLMNRMVSEVYTLWARSWPQFTRDLAKIHGVVCPSRLLAADMRQYNSHACFIPNYHDYPKLPPRNRNSTLVVGWAGSHLHWESWRETKAWQHIPKGAYVEIVDHYPVFQMLQKQGFRGNFKPALPERDYLLTVQNWDAYIIPMQGEYDRRKSWVKALDACYCGTPWYGVGDAVDDVYAGVPGVLPRLAADSVWAKEGLRPIGMREWAEAQRITQHLEEWKEILL